MTFKCDLRAHASGIASVIFLVGESFPAAIRKTWSRKFGCNVLSITTPYGVDTHHIEHTGREIAGGEIVYSDDLSQIDLLEELS